ncbi:NnrS family protein [Sphingopyxis sp. XHP0097]|uniref:NnrS family protein n=1 Tax=Sphingopyxis jiangsuensis TaxID=2871171 RepID=A0ABS7MCF1_9SPHN|nr:MULTISPECIES: NnrS family protein [Sphingopyxis]MBY4636498.1 NnrS family protein [Sphingopyxis jiangsuensis]
MRAEDLRHDRLMRLPPVLRSGFRPFFFAAACWALGVTALWVGALSGRLELPTHMDSLAWHRHEMLFGFLGSAIAGFLLTAIPNWTGRLPVAGGRLALLFALWLSARLALLFSAHIGAVAAVILDVGFPAALAFVAAREILAAKNRNVPIVIVLGLLTIANGLDHAEALGFDVNPGLGWRAGFALVLMLVSLIGGRIIPSFTRNWLAKQGVRKGLPGQPGPFDMATLAMSGAALAGWVAAPDAKLVGALLVIAGGLHAIRLARWSGLKTIRDPLVVILHISYAWLPLGLLLLGASAFVWSIPASSALHALGAGAMSSMTLAVMTRATLGHTGRPLVADRATQLIYLLVTLGAVLRVAAPVLPFDYLRSIAVAGTMWGGAFLLFACVYGPKLLGPRPDGRP